MIVIGTVEDARSTEHRVGLYEGYADKIYLIQSPPAQRPSPYAYLVKQSPGSVLRTHFHHNAQFQVFVHGEGTVGRHAVRNVTVHYAGQQNGYGPLVAGEGGLWYFTLRPVTSRDVWFLPEANTALDRAIPKLQVMSSPVDVGEAPSPAADGSRVEQVIEPRANGLGAWLVRGGPHEDMPLPDAAFTSIGAFFLVVNGSVAHGGRQLSRLATIWCSGERLNLRAGEGGACVLITQFPQDAWVYETPPVGPPEFSQHRPDKPMMRRSASQ